MVEKELNFRQTEFEMAVEHYFYWLAIYAKPPQNSLV